VLQNEALEEELSSWRLHGGPDAGLLATLGVSYAVLMLLLVGGVLWRHFYGPAGPVYPIDRYLVCTVLCSLWLVWCCRLWSTECCYHGFVLFAGCSWLCQGCCAAVCGCQFRVSAPGCSGKAELKCSRRSSLARRGVLIVLGVGEWVRFGCLLGQSRGMGRHQAPCRSPSLRRIRAGQLPAALPALSSRVGSWSARVKRGRPCNSLSGS
jgi:hypothetical protein